MRQCHTGLPSVLPGCPDSSTQVRSRKRPGTDRERTQPPDPPAAGVAGRWPAARPSQRRPRPAESDGKPRRKSGCSNDLGTDTERTQRRSHRPGRSTTETPRKTRRPARDRRPGIVRILLALVSLWFKIRIGRPPGSLSAQVVQQPSPANGYGTNPTARRRSHTPGAGRGRRSDGAFRRIATGVPPDPRLRSGTPSGWRRAPPSRRGPARPAPAIGVPAIRLGGAPGRAFSLTPIGSVGVRLESPTYTVGSGRRTGPALDIGWDRRPGLTSPIFRSASGRKARPTRSESACPGRPARSS